jgi:hypothetical protein
MDTDDISERYARLRRQLEEAYARLPWDSQRIDSIADEMLPLERALAARHVNWGARPGDDPPALAPLASAAERRTF